MKCLSVSLPFLFYLSLPASLAFTRSLSPRPIDHGHCLRWVLYFTVQCSWKGVFATPTCHPSSTLKYTHLTQYLSFPDQWTRAGIFTSAPSSISHLWCPSMPVWKVGGGADLNWWVKADKTSSHSKSGRVAELLKRRTQRTWTLVYFLTVKKTNSQSIIWKKWVGPRFSKNADRDVDKCKSLHYCLRFAAPCS